MYLIKALKILLKILFHYFSLQVSISTCKILTQNKINSLNISTKKSYLE